MKKSVCAFTSVLILGLIFSTSSVALTCVDTELGVCTGGGSMPCKELQEMFKHWDAKRKSCFIICKISFLDPSPLPTPCDGPCSEVTDGCKGDSSTVATKELKITEASCLKYTARWDTDCKGASWTGDHYTRECKPELVACNVTTTVDF